MKKVIKIIAFAVFIAILGLLAMSKYIEGFYWTYKSSASSPNVKFTINEFRYESDVDGHAPYGSYLFLQRGITLKKRRQGYVIFAGYCKNRLSYQWDGDSKINISCNIDNPASIRTLVEKVYGIKISIISKK